MTNDKVPANAKNLRQHHPTSVKSGLNHTGELQADGKVWSLPSSTRGSSAGVPSTLITVPMCLTGLISWAGVELPFLTVFIDHGLLLTLFVFTTSAFKEC